MSTKSTIFFFVAVLLSFSHLFSQQSILVLNSTSDVVYKLNANDGTVVNSNFITLPTGTAKGITQVNDKIWIADQIADDIYIYNFDGTLFTTLLGDVVGLDNIRGLNVVNNEVWVTNAGSNNGAQANSIRRFTTAGVPLGYYSTVNSPFDVLDNGTAAFVSSFNNPSAIQILGYDGTVTGSLPSGALLANIEQMNFNAAGNLIVATFANHTAAGNSRGIYEINPSTGAILNSWPTPGTSGNAGVLQLGNGSYIYTDGSTVRILDPITGIHTTVVSGSGAFQYLAKINESAMSVSETTSISMEIYPNPVSETIFVNSKSEIRQINILSSDGRMIKMRKANAKRISIFVGDLSPGVYFIQMTTDKTKETHKFIKK